MMKKIEKELDEAPKKLRSIMAYSSNNNVPGTSSRVNTARDNNNNVFNVRVIDTSYSNNNQ
jgi:hypothetical protein